MTIEAFLGRVGWATVVLLAPSELRRLLAECQALTACPWSPVRCEADAWFGHTLGQELINAVKMALQGCMVPWGGCLLVRGWP